MLAGQSVGFWGAAPSLDKLETWTEFSILLFVGKLQNDRYYSPDLLLLLLIPSRVAASPCDGCALLNMVHEHFLFILEGMVWQILSLGLSFRSRVVWYNFLNTFGQILSYFELFGPNWSYLKIFLSYLELFWNIWSCLEQIGAIWSNFKQFGDIWRHLEAFWAI